MGEAWVRHLYGDRVRALSAGTDPGSAVDPRAIACMQEVGVLMHASQPKSISTAVSMVSSPVDLAITVCSGAEACPRPRNCLKIVHHGFDDPPALALEHPHDDAMIFYRRVRDEIQAFVLTELPGLLDIPNPVVVETEDNYNDRYHGTHSPASHEDGAEMQMLAADESENDNVALLEPSHNKFVQQADDDDSQKKKKKSSDGGFGIFERYLTIWVALCIVIGSLIGYYAPSVATAFSKAESYHISFPIAILLWIMILPMLVQIDFSSIKRVKDNPNALILTTLINYLVKPFSMYAFAMLFFRVVFKSAINDLDLANSYIAGCVLLAGAPCTAMVFVWSFLTGGDGGYTLTQVALNDLLMLGLYVPICMLLLGVSSIPLPYGTIILAVGLFIAAPMLIAVLLRRYTIKHYGLPWLNSQIHRCKPITIIALLLMLTLIFIFQGQKIGDKPVHILMIAVPILIQSIFNFALCYYIGYKICIDHSRLAPSALIATSNFFELAVAVAVSVYGLDSGAALATVVGVLIEVPCMLAFVQYCNWNKPKLVTHNVACDCEGMRNKVPCLRRRARPLPVMA